MSVALNQIYSFRRSALTPLGSPPREHTQVGQFIILSMLLHVLFIVLFGDSTGGGPSRASQLLGGFSASLQARGTSNMAAPPSFNSTSVDAADSQQTQSQSVSGLMPRAESRIESPIQPLQPSVRTIPDASPGEPDKLAIPDALPALPILSKTVVQPVTAFVIPAPKPAATAVTVPATAPAVDALAPIEPLPRTLPLSVPKPIELNVAPSINREFGPYVPPALAVAPPTLPAPIPTISPGAPIAPMVLPPVSPIAMPSLAPPEIKREFVAPANIEVREPLVVPPPIATIAPTTLPKTAPEFVPVAAPALAPVVAPNVPQQPLQLATPNSRPSAVTAPAQTDRNLASPAQNMPRDAATGAATPASSVPASPASVGAPNGQLSGQPAGASTGAPTAATSTLQPKSTDDIFGPRRDAGSSPRGQVSDSMPPAKRLDLDAARRSARESTGERSGPRTLFPFPTAPKAAVKSDVTKIFDKALKRTDCKDAYADMGLAAVIPLVRDAIKQDGCKW